jgi:hypothetical protein
MLKMWKPRQGSNLLRLLGRTQVLCPDELRSHGMVGLEGVEPIDLPDVGGVLCR